MRKRPNIIFILTDDQGPWALGKETPELITPNLDRMADEGIRFTNFFCASPVCSPARCSIVTGRIPSAHGVHDWLSSGNVDKAALPADMQQMFRDENAAIDYLAGMPNVFDELHENGYQMGFVGKWHMGDSMRPRPGFDTWNVLLRGGAHYKHADICVDGKPQFCDQYITDYFTDRAVEYIDSCPESPFFLALHYTAPHTPWAHEEHREDMLKLYDDCDFNSHPLLPIHPNQVGNMEIGDTEEKRRYLLKGYYAAISAVDEGVGKVFDALERNNIADDTVVIFSGDNGMNLGQHGVWGKGNGTWPMNMYDSSVKVPFIMWGPKWIRKGATVANLYSHYDILPTLREYLKLPAVEGLPGISFLKEMTSPVPNHDRTLCIMDEYGPVRMVRNRHYKLVWEPLTNRHQLYDLTADPDENINVFDHAEYHEVQQALLAELRQSFDCFALSPFDGQHLAPTGSGQFGKVTYSGENVFDPSITLYRDRHP